MRKLLTGLAAAMVVSVSGTVAQANLLTQNPSFESVNNGNNSFANNGNTLDGWDFTFDADPGGFAGWNPFENSDDVPSNIDGSVALRLNNTTITTDASIRPVVVAGVDYILEVNVGELATKNSAMQTVAIDFFDVGGALISSAETTFLPIDRAEDDPLATQSVSGVAPVGAVTAGARYTATGDWSVVDDFRLNVVPEPGSMMLAAAGAGALLLRRRDA
jgi:hypothetical protein